jgi:hypothetical protein
LAENNKCGFYRKLFFNKKNITPPVFSGVEQYSSLIAFSKIMFMSIIRQFWQKIISAVFTENTEILYMFENRV